MNKLVHIAIAALFLSNSVFAADRDSQYPVPTSPDTTTPHKVGLFTNFHKTGPYCVVKKSNNPVPFPEKKEDLRALEFKSLIMNTTLEGYMFDNNVAGITIIKNGNIVFQEFNYQRNSSDTFTSFSTAKSIISILVGIALDKGFIKSLDDTVSTYATSINDSVYKDVTIKNLLRMSSGVGFNETYTGKNDIYYMDQALRFNSESSVIRTINSFKRTSKEQGKEFNYSSQDTVVLAEVLRSATGKSVCEFMQETLWDKIGAEQDAYWTTDSTGKELGYAFFNATQNDYAKLGVMLANNGTINSTKVLSAEYIDDATNVKKQPAGFQVGMKLGVGYGYQFWLKERPGRFFMQGAYGQYVGVDQQTKTVIVVHSMNPVENPQRTTVATYRLMKALAGDVDAK